MTRVFSFTPFELIFGCNAVIPVNLDNGSEHTQPDAEEVIGQGCDPETIQKMQEDTKKRLEKAKVNIICAQQKQKEVYDRQPDVYAVGALVLKKDFTRKKRKGEKLDSKWVGPYKIAKALGKGLYHLEDVNDPSNVICRVLLYGIVWSRTFFLRSPRPSRSHANITRAIISKRFQKSGKVWSIL